jgi:hypothetical protein
MDPGDAGRGGVLGDDAFHQVEAELDVAELNALGANR